MASVIQWFLVEIERRLGADVSPDRMFQLQKEAAAHLQETADEMEAQGMSRKEAERAAVIRFGTPKAFRMAELRQLEGHFLGLPTKVWCVAIGALSIVACTLCNLPSNLGFGVLPIPMFGLFLVGSGALLLFGVLCFRLGRNPLVTTLLIGASLVPILWLLIGSSYVRVENQLVSKFELTSVAEQIIVRDATRRAQLHILDEGLEWATGEKRGGTWDRNDFRTDSLRLKEKLGSYLSVADLDRLQKSQHKTYWMAANGLSFDRQGKEFPGVPATMMLHMKLFDNPESAAYSWRNFAQTNDYSIRVQRNDVEWSERMLDKIEKARTKGFDRSVVELPWLYVAYGLSAIVLAIIGQTGVGLRSIVSRLRNRVGFA